MKNFALDNPYKYLLQAQVRQDLQQYTYKNPDK